MLQKDDDLSELANQKKTWCITTHGKSDEIKTNKGFLDGEEPLRRSRELGATRGKPQNGRPLYDAVVIALHKVTYRAATRRCGIGGGVGWGGVEKEGGANDTCTTTKARGLATVSTAQEECIPVEG